MVISNSGVVGNSDLQVAVSARRSLCTVTSYADSVAVSYVIRHCVAESGDYSRVECAAAGAYARLVTFSGAGRSLQNSPSTGVNLSVGVLNSGSNATVDTSATHGAGTSCATAVVVRSVNVSMVASTFSVPVLEGTVLFFVHHPPVAVRTILHGVLTTNGADVVPCASAGRGMLHDPSNSALSGVFDGVSRLSANAVFSIANLGNCGNLDGHVANLAAVYCVAVAFAGCSNGFDQLVCSLCRAAANSTVNGADLNVHTGNVAVGAVGSSTVVVANNLNLAGSEAYSALAVASAVNALAVAAAGAFALAVAFTGGADALAAFYGASHSAGNYFYSTLSRAGFAFSFNNCLAVAFCANVQAETFADFAGFVAVNQTVFAATSYENLTSFAISAINVDYTSGAVNLTSSLAISALVLQSTLADGAFCVFAVNQTGTSTSGAGYLLGASASGAVNERVATAGVANSRAVAGVALAVAVASVALAVAAAESALAVAVAIITSSFVEESRVDIAEADNAGVFPVVTGNDVGTGSGAAAYSSSEELSVGTIVQSALGSVDGVEFEQVVVPFGGVTFVNYEVEAGASERTDLGGNASGDYAEYVDGRFIEAVHAERGQLAAFGNHNGLQAQAVLECLVADGFNSCRDLNAAELRTTECVVADLGERIRKFNYRDGSITELIRVDLGDSSLDVEFVKVSVAPAESLSIDISYSEVKCVVSVDGSRNGDSTVVASYNEDNFSSLSFIVQSVEHVAVSPEPVVSFSNSDTGDTACIECKVADFLNGGRNVNSATDVAATLEQASSDRGYAFLNVYVANITAGENADLVGLVVCVGSTCVNGNISETGAVECTSAVVLDAFMQVDVCEAAAALESLLADRGQGLRKNNGVQTAAVEECLSSDGGSGLGKSDVAQTAELSECLLTDNQSSSTAGLEHNSVDAHAGLVEVGVVSEQAGTNLGNALTDNNLGDGDVSSNLLPALERALGDIGSLAFASDVHRTILQNGDVTVAALAFVRDFGRSKSGNAQQSHHSDNNCHNCQKSFHVYLQ